MGKSIDITGKRFGNLTSVKFAYHDKVEYWYFKCELCHTDGVRRKTDVMRGKIKSCGCHKNKGSNNGQWYGYEELNGRTFGHYKKGAKKRNIEFNVTIEYLWDVYIKQNKKCPYTGVELILSPKTSDNRTPENASLDRIDSSKGYIEGNVQWVLKKVNNMKNDMSHDEFIELCSSISRHCPFDPLHTKGNKKLKENIDKNLDD